jgi:hypothetical protein
MQARYEYVEKLKADVNERLRQFVKDQGRYSQLL